MTCRHGHHWDAPITGAEHSPGSPNVCPICGSASNDLPTPSEPTASESATLPPPADAQTDAAYPPAEENVTLPLSEAPGGGPGPKCAVAGYEILGELGRGGMGVVYKARHIKLNRLVALKIILAGSHAGEEDLRRFRTEAEAVAGLHHPNIVQIYDVGEQDGLPYCSLEFVAGGTLEARLDGTPWLAPQAAQLLETLAHAMHAAHLPGIIHRDLKPANILLHRKSATRNPKSKNEDGSAVSDFGFRISDFGF
jgi:serine/threonine protein kinase